MLRQLKDFIIRLFTVVRVRREERKLMGETGCISLAGRGAKVEAWTMLAGKWMGEIHF